MSIAADLVTTLGGIFDGKLFPSVKQAMASAPYAVYQLVDGIPETYLDGMSGEGVSRFQVDIFATQKQEVDSLAEDAKEAMDAATLFSSTCVSQQDLFEDPVNLYRVSLDFSVRQ